MALSHNRRGSLSRGPAVGSRWPGVSLKFLSQHPVLGWISCCWCLGPGGGGEAGEKGRGTGGGALGPSGILGKPHTCTGGVSRDPFPQIILWGFFLWFLCQGFSSLLSLSTSPMCKTSCCYPVVLSPFWFHWSEDKCSVSPQQLGLPGHPSFSPAHVHVPPCKPSPLFPVQLPSLLSAVLAPDPSSERASSLCVLCLVMGGWGEGISRDDNYWATSCYPPSFPPAILAPWDLALHLVPLLRVLFSIPPLTGVRLPLHLCGMCFDPPLMALATFCIAFCSFDLPCPSCLTSLTRLEALLRWEMCLVYYCIPCSALFNISARKATWKL